jgi:hypothetical protein
MHMYSNEVVVMFLCVHVGLRLFSLDYSCIEALDQNQIVLEMILPRLWIHIPSKFLV